MLLIQHKNMSRITLIRLSHSFAFSGCGWLTPFHLGVIDSMKQHSFLTKESILAGTSGGSIAALIGCIDYNPKDAMELLITMSKKPNILYDIDGSLRQTLFDILQEDVISKCNNRLHVVITNIWPMTSLAGMNIISHFENKQQLIDVIAASCFIPGYSARKLSTLVHGNHGQFVDGGLRAFIPPIGDIRVTPFPLHFLRHLSSRSPNIMLPSSKYSLPQLVRWSLFPPSEKQLYDLYYEGFKASEEYIQLHCKIN